MPRSNIDLSWLVSLLTKSPTPTANPSFGATWSPETGAIDAAGNEIAESALKGDITSPYVRPSFWQRQAYPAQSANIDELNNQFITARPFANLKNDVSNDILARNTKIVRGTMAPQFQDPSLSDLQVGLLTGGDFRPTAVNPEARALLGARNNLPLTQSQTDLAEANANLTRARGIEKAAPTESEILSEDAKNRLQRLTGVDRTNLAIAERQAANDLERLPTEEEVREQVLKNKLQSERNLVPLQTANAIKEENLAGGINDLRLQLQPETQRIARNTITRNLVESSQIPAATEPFGTIINPDGSVTYHGNVPGYVSPFEKQKVDTDIMTGGTTMKSPSGLEIKVPPRSTLPRTVDPMTGREVGTSTNAAPARPVETKPVTLGESAGGPAPELPTVTSPGISKAEALSKLGFFIDKNGQLQAFSRPSSWISNSKSVSQPSSMWFSPDDIKKAGTSKVDEAVVDFERRKALALRIANNPNLK